MYNISKYTESHYLIKNQDDTLLNEYFASILIPKSEIDDVIDKLITHMENQFLKDSKQTDFVLHCNDTKENLSTNQVNHVLKD